MYARTVTRNRLRRVRWDPSRGSLGVEPESVRLEVPKAYITWQNERWQIAAGTYRVGFGQRLTFDVTDQVTPNGLFGDYELRRENELFWKPCHLPTSRRLVFGHDKHFPACAGRQPSAACY